MEQEMTQSMKNVNQYMKGIFSSQGVVCTPKVVGAQTTSED